MEMSQEFCFCTLAVGKRYRHHARMLAQDIQQYIPATALCILTDEPEDFREFTHVLAFKHRLQSVKGYHDKRFVLEKSLSLFNSCMFLDSDVRVIGAVEKPMNPLPGITARTGCDLLHHIANINSCKEIQVIEEVAQKLDIDIQKVQWFHEFMFFMRKQDELEKKFFQFWETISYFFETQGIYHGEGYAMGLAAEKVGLMIRFDREDKFPFFKDNIELIRIKNGQSDLQEKAIYFQMHQEIEYPKLSILRRIINKLIKHSIFLYRILRLKILVQKDEKFHKLFGVS
ncbi:MULTISPECIES: hypothetical protein [Calothrix]|uniref:Uncharacterized protein n=2 Tax=Calothrix TaxID=1186 RepID=A0ABR8A277_9CYAN|nr:MULTISPECIES: hypothetical protein [Calothrix]MBD2193955.1 hypothetical protein [Calothrix parietina FACHB-288]MBD2222962.1 hypothetical protein [Calothrix anomala FACHB-343]